MLFCINLHMKTIGKKGEGKIVEKREEHLPTHVRLRSEKKEDRVVVVVDRTLPFVSPPVRLARSEWIARSLT